MYKNQNLTFSDFQSWAVFEFINTHRMFNISIFLLFMKYWTISFLPLLSLSFLYQLLQFFHHSCLCITHLTSILNYTDWNPVGTYRSTSFPNTHSPPEMAVNWSDILVQSFKVLLPSLLWSYICCRRISPTEKQRSPYLYISYALLHQV